MDIAKFMEICLDEYDNQIEDQFDGETSIIELEGHHALIKEELLENVSTKWRSHMGDMEIPTNLTEELDHKLDSNFAKLKRLSNKHHHHQENKLEALAASKEAIQLYNEEMEKYFLAHPNASPKEIEKQHGRTYRLALETAQTKIGQGRLAEMLGDMRKEMEARRNVYYERAALVLKSVKDPPAIGIDLGTTMLCVMVFYKGKVELIPNRSQGNSRTTPSYVAFHANNTDTFGRVAKDQSYKHPEITVYDAKRMIGRPFDDEKLQGNLGKWPFEVVNIEGNVKIKTGDRCRFPHEVSSRLLVRLRMMAEDHLNLPRGIIKKAVVTVPAYFTEPQRRATSQAAACAGLDVLNILSEPTAASIAYSWERRDSGNRKALIYDLGGGTFDVAVAKVNATNVEILCVGGDTHLGGQDFDQLLMDYCTLNFKQTTGIDLMAARDSSETTKRNEVRSALSRIKLQCEKAKEDLSTSDQTTIDIMGISGDHNLSVVITKLEFENLIRPLVQTTLDIVDGVLLDARVKGVFTKEEIDDIILVGGSTRIPLVKELLIDYFGGKQLCVHINPDEAVAYGAAIQAAMMNNEETLKHISVNDVTPMSLGVEVIGQRFSTVVPKNSEIPCSLNEIYHTTSDNQTVCNIKIFQGENPSTKGNKLLGSFQVDGFPPKRAGEEEAVVTMTIDANGILQVEAASLSTGSSNSITISANRMGMDKATIDLITQECAEIELY